MTDEKTYDQIAEETVLPDWVPLQPIPEGRTVVYNDAPRAKKRIVVQETEEKFSTVEEAYDAITAENRERKITYDQRLFDLGLLGGEQEMPTTPWTEEQRGVRLLINFGAEESTKLLKNHYYMWLQRNEEYQANPGDWVLAYNWLNLHPAFWTYRNERTREDYRIDYENGLGDIYEWVTRNDDGEPVIGMETGGHTPDLMHRYHDLRLDTYASCFEDAYVMLAYYVNYYFNPDGTEKDVPELETKEVPL